MGTRCDVDYEVIVSVQLTSYTLQLHVILSFNVAFISGEVSADVCNVLVFFVPVHPIDLVGDVPLISNQLNLICDIFQCMLSVIDIS